MTILTNDVTTKLWWDGPPVQRLLRAGRPDHFRVVAKLLAIWLDYRTKIFGEHITGTCLHDPLTAAEAAGRSFVMYSVGTMAVGADATTTFIPSRQGPHRAGAHVEAAAFLDWFSRRVA